MKTQIISFAVPSKAKWLVCVLLAVAFFVAFGTVSLRAELPVIGDDSDFVWINNFGPIEVYFLRFHPNGRYVIASYGGKAFKIDVLDSGKIVKNYYPGSFFRLSPSGKYVGLAYEDDEYPLLPHIRVFDFETDSTISIADIPVNGDVKYFAFSQDDKYLVVGGSRLYLYDVSTGKLLKSHPLPILHELISDPVADFVCFNPDGTKVIFNYYNKEIRDRWGLHQKYYQSVWYWDLERDTLVEFFKNAAVGRPTKDGRKVMISSKGIRMVMDLETLEIVDTLHNLEGVFTGGEDDDISWSWDGKYLGIMPVPNGLYIYDVERKMIVYQGPKNKYPWAGWSIDFSPNGKYVVYGWSAYCLDFERIKRKIEQALSEVKEEAKPFHATIVYPNPTHDVVQVRFGLDAPLPTTIEVMDLTGRMVKEVENKFLEAGEYVYTIDLTDVAAGVYYLQIQAGNKMFNEKIVVSH